MIIGSSQVHADAFKVSLKFVKFIFSCICEFHLAGYSENATKSHTISIHKPIIKGKFKLIFVKKGSVIIKNILKNETHHFIEEDIFLNLSSFHKFVNVSCKKAPVFQVVKASAHKLIKIAPAKKYQKLSQKTNIKLDKTKRTLLIIIVVLFQSLSHIIQAGS